MVTNGTESAARTQPISSEDLAFLAFTHVAIHTNIERNNDLYGNVLNILL